MAMRSMLELTPEEPASLAILYLYVDHTHISCARVSATDVRKLSIVCVEWLRSPPNPITDRARAAFSWLLETSSIYRFFVAEQERFLKREHPMNAMCWVKTADLLWSMGGVEVAAPPVLFSYDSFCYSRDSYLQRWMDDQYVSMAAQLEVAPPAMLLGCSLFSLYWDYAAQVLLYDCKGLRGILHCKGLSVWLPSISIINISQ